VNNILKDYLKGFLDLFYPETCVACGKALYINEQVLCLECLIDLPRTKFHHIPDNEVARIFWGRINIANATSFMYFNRDSRYRRIIHELKYNGKQKAGIEMGRLFGIELRESLFARADLLHPVPLHPSKLRKRGYNQSELISKGISVSLNIPVETAFIKRIISTPTQTRKTRYERWENVKESFTINSPENLKNKHIVLIDDVITTGATIEACASALMEAAEGITVSVASLAFVKLQ
jgi:ComF family protein